MCGTGMIRREWGLIPGLLNTCIVNRNPKEQS